MQQDEFEPRYREMDPTTEKLLFDGSRLRNGMVVLYASPESRVEVREGMNEGELDTARERNRWFIVSELTISIGSPGSVAFIATYFDHTERKIEETMSSPWLVKRDSIPADYDPTAPAREQGFRLLTQDIPPKPKEFTRFPGLTNYKSSLKVIPKEDWPPSDEEASILAGSTERVEDETPKCNATAMGMLDEGHEQAAHDDGHGNHWGG
jgi:hypothetical protein